MISLDSDEEDEEEKNKELEVIDEEDVGWPKEELAKKMCPMHEEILDDIGYNDENPLKLLQIQALALAGMTYDQAFAVDTSAIRTKVTEYHMVILCEQFYKRVREDKEEWFSAIFSGSDVEDMQMNLCDYLVQRIGGAPNYSARQGFTDLARKHEMFEMSQRTAERWLKHMQASLDGMADEIAEKFRLELMNLMTYTAYYLVLCQSTQKKFETMGPYFLNPPPKKDSD